MIIFILILILIPIFFGIIRIEEGIRERQALESNERREQAITNKIIDKLLNDDWHNFDRVSMANNALYIDNIVKDGSYDAIEVKLMSLGDSVRMQVQVTDLRPNKSDKLTLNKIIIGETAEKLIDVMEMYIFDIKMRGAYEF